MTLQKMLPLFPRSNYCTISCTDSVATKLGNDTLFMPVWTSKGKLPLHSTCNNKKGIFAKNNSNLML